jgi:hypothetical protein
MRRCLQTHRLQGRFHADQPLLALLQAYHLSSEVVVNAPASDRHKPTLFCFPKILNRVTDNFSVTERQSLCQRYQDSLKGRLIWLKSYRFGIGKGDPPGSPLRDISSEQVISP